MDKYVINSFSYHCNECGHQGLTEVEVYNQEYIKSLTDIASQFGTNKENSSKKICKMDNEQFSWVLRVDDQKIPISGTSVEYFQEHYKKLGYTVFINERTIYE